jgi:hypothetical protein
LEVLGLSTSFDAANAADAVVRDREAARLISCSQAGAGAWLTRLPDHTVRYSKVHSDLFVVASQRRLGLYLTALKPALTAMEASGHSVSQYDWLGDAAINSANHSDRHSNALRAVFDAFCAVADPDQHGSLRLGDRGDGTPAGKHHARARYGHINAGHVPDFIRFGVRSHCYEFKCYTPFLQSPALGLGSREKGGAPSTADGGRRAFGNTEEAICYRTTGVLAERDADVGYCADRRETGRGWVRATTDHDYADAQRRGNPITVLGMETTGALMGPLDSALRQLARVVRRLGPERDHTRYGLSRASPHEFYAHHAAAISAAAVYSDAAYVVNAAASMSFLLSLGLRPIASP